MAAPHDDSYSTKDDGYAAYHTASYSANIQRRMSRWGSGGGASIRAVLDQSLSYLGRRWITNLSGETKLKAAFRTSKAATFPSTLGELSDNSMSCQTSSTKKERRTMRLVDHSSPSRRSCCWAPNREHWLEVR